MNVSENSRALKVCFGSFLKNERLGEDLSTYDVGYVLGKCAQTVWGWEAGHSFPGSVVSLKKLAILYKDTPNVLKDIVTCSGIRPSRAEWDRFETTVYARSGKMLSAMQPVYVPKDERDFEYKKAFGGYLCRERIVRGISFSAMARAFGVVQQVYCNWESGSAFPSDAMVLAMLDKLYGNTFDVLFGLCKEAGIHLSRGEVREVMRRVDEFKDTRRWQRGKSVPPKWAAYVRERRAERVKTRMGLPDGFFRALSILDNGEISSRQFARRMWPESKMWSSNGYVRTFRGISSRVTGPGHMRIITGALWHKMARKSWVAAVDGRCRISAKGKERLEATLRIRKRKGLTA